MGAEIAETLFSVVRKWVDGDFLSAYHAVFNIFGTASRFSFLYRRVYVLCSAWYFIVYSLHAVWRPSGQEHHGMQHEVSGDHSHEQVSRS